MVVTVFAVFHVYFSVLYREREGGREIQKVSNLLSHSPDVPNNQGWARPKAGSVNTIPVSHAGGRSSTTWTCSVLECTLAGRVGQNSNPGTLKWDVSISNIVLSAEPNSLPVQFGIFEVHLHALKCPYNSSPILTRRDVYVI